MKFHNEIFTIQLKQLLKEIFVLDGYIRKRRCQINDLSFHFNKLETRANET